MQNFENSGILAKRPLRGLLALRALVSSWIGPDFEIHHNFRNMEFLDFPIIFFVFPIFHDVNQFLSLLR